MDIVATYVSKCVAAIGGAPILKVTVAVVPFFEEDGGTEAEIAEQSLPLPAPGHQTAVVKALLIFDADHQPTLSGFPFDGERLVCAQHHRLYRYDVLIGLESANDYLEMQVIRKCDEHDVVRRKSARSH